MSPACEQRIGEAKGNAEPKDAQHSRQGIGDAVGELTPYARTGIASGSGPAAFGLRPDQVM